MSENTPPGPENPYGTGPGQPYGRPSGDYPQGQTGGYESAPPPPPAAGGSRPGELLDRFLARLLDLLVLFVLQVVVIAPILVLVVGRDNVGALGTGGAYAAAALGAVLTTALNLGYFGYLDSTRGRTLGKMVMKLYVVGAAGGKPTFEESVKRNIWLALPILGLVPALGAVVSGLGQLAAIITIAVGISSDPVNRRPWTDKFAGTQVLKQA